MQNLTVGATKSALSFAFAWLSRVISFRDVSIVTTEIIDNWCKCYNLIAKPGQQKPQISQQIPAFGGNWHKSKHRHTLRLQDFFCINRRIFEFGHYSWAFKWHLDTYYLIQTYSWLREVASIQITRIVFCWIKVIKRFNQVSYEHNLTCPV